MIISRATKHDLSAIQDILLEYGKMTADASLFNHRDISLIAKEDSGKVLGFIWTGLMAKNTVGYIDKFVIAKSHSKQGVGQKLINALIPELLKRGVRRVFGVIQQDQWHDKSAINALKGSMSAHSIPYTYVEADVAFAESQLKEAGVL